MKNIELKIKVKNFKTIEKPLKLLGAIKHGVLNQKDTYLNCSKGRFKMRETNNKIFELIYYKRLDKMTNKLSKYSIVSLDRTRFKQLEVILETSIGIKAVVLKSRILWLFKNTRIHLDDVKGLGKFLELETVLKKIKKPEGEKECLEICKLLELNEFQKIKESYSDFLSEQTEDKNNR